MLETFGALILFVLVVAFWRGLWTAIMTAAILVFMLAIGGSFVYAAFATDASHAILLALTPAALFGLYRVWQTRKLERILLQDRISRQNEKFSAVGVDCDGSKVGGYSNRAVPADGCITTGYGNRVSASRPSFIHNGKGIKGFFGSQVK